MQVEAFSGLLEKYQDYDMSPAAEDIGKIRARFEQPWTTYFFIEAEGEDVGVIRVVDKKDGSRKRISPLWIMKEHRNKGYAQDAIRAAEAIYGEDNVTVDSQTGAITVTQTAQPLDECVVVFETVLTGNRIKRIVVPRAQIVDRSGEISYTDGDAIIYPAQFKAYPNTNGAYHIEYIATAG